MTVRDEFSAAIEDECIRRIEDAALAGKFPLSMWVRRYINFVIDAWLGGWGPQEQHEYALGRVVEEYKKEIGNGS